MGQLKLEICAYCSTSMSNDTQSIYRQIETSANNADVHLAFCSFEHMDIFNEEADAKERMA